MKQEIKDLKTANEIIGIRIKQMEADHKAELDDIEEKAIREEVEDLD